MKGEGLPEWTFCGAELVVQDDPAICGCMPKAQDGAPSACDESER